MHRKVPAWFGGRPCGKGPDLRKADLGPRRAAHPVEGRMVPAHRRGPRRRGLGRGQGARGTGRRQRPGSRGHHRRSGCRRPDRRPAQRRGHLRPLPDQQAGAPALRPGPGRGLAHRDRGHRRSLPPPDRRPARFQQSGSRGLVSPEMPDSPRQIQPGGIPSPTCESARLRRARAAGRSGWSYATAGAIGPWSTTTTSRSLPPTGSCSICGSAGTGRSRPRECMPGSWPASFAGAPARDGAWRTAPGT